jgi:hypothetical protein
MTPPPDPLPQEGGGRKLHKIILLFSFQRINTRLFLIHNSSPSLGMGMARNINIPNYGISGEID